ncbi:hypothetical protein D3C79_728940 [compost metagenome]
MLADIALAVGLQGAQRRIAQADAIGLQLDQTTLGVVQACIEVKTLYTVLLLRQLLALQGECTLGSAQRAADIQPPFGLASQPGPQLPEPGQVEVDTPGQALLQAATAVDAVVTQLHGQRTEGPVLPGAFGLYLEHCQLAAQAPL